MIIMMIIIIDFPNARGFIGFALYFVEQVFKTMC